MKSAHKIYLKYISNYFKFKNAKVAKHKIKIKKLIQTIKI